MSLHLPGEKWQLAAGEGCAPGYVEQMLPDGSWTCIAEADFKQIQADPTKAAEIVAAALAAINGAPTPAAPDVAVLVRGGAALHAGSEAAWTWYQQLLRTLGFACLLAFAALPLRAQGNPATVTALKPGQVQIITQYVNANGKLVADTTTLQILPVAIATIDLYNQINPPRWISSTTVGKTFCAYAQAKDADGNLLTGRPMVFKSSDTTVARISASAACPDTSVDMSKVLTLPLPPPLFAVRR